MTDLLNCPFCGGEASLCDDADHSIVFWVGCATVGCIGHEHWEETEAEAIAAWNTRATPDPLSDPRVKALVEAVAGMERESRKYLRTADFHAETCTCYRCKEDRAFAALRAIDPAAIAAKLKGDGDDR